MQLVELAVRVLHTDASAGDDEQRRSALESAVADLVNGLPQELAVHHEKAPTSQTPERHYQGAVELQAKEEM